MSWAGEGHPQWSPGPRAWAQRLGEQRGNLPETVTGGQAFPLTWGREGMGQAPGAVESGGKGHRSRREGWSPSSVTSPKHVRPLNSHCPAHSHQLHRPDACPSGWSGLRLGHHGLCVSEELDRDPGGWAETRTACGVSQAWGGGRCSEAPLLRGKVTSAPGAHVSQAWGGSESPLLRGKVLALVPRVREEAYPVSRRPREGGHGGAMRRGTRGQSSEDQLRPRAM